MKNSTFFHIGNLNLASLKKKKKSSFSYEGNGLSISLHPEAWRRIARLGGGKVYSLTKQNPHLLKYSKQARQEATIWSLENGFIKPAKKFSVPHFDEDGNKDGYFHFDTKEEAIEQAENPKQVKEINGYMFDVQGIKYWNNSFSNPVSHDLAEDFAVIFFAEASGYEGIWWNEKLDVSRLSAPRGVIFQQYLKTWQIKELQK